MTKKKKIHLVECYPLMVEILEAEGEILFTPGGNSMFPMLRHRKDQILLKRIDSKKLEKYDLPLYRRNDTGKFVLHRVVGITKEGCYIMMGDNQIHKEYGVKQSQMVGLVKGFWRNERYYDCNDFGYRAYCHFWQWLYPLRYLFYKGRRLMWRITRRRKSK